MVNEVSFSVAYNCAHLLLDRNSITIPSARAFISLSLRYSNEIKPLFTIGEGVTHRQQECEVRINVVIMNSLN